MFSSVRIKPSIGYTSLATAPRFLCGFLFDTEWAPSKAVISERCITSGKFSILEAYTNSIVIWIFQEKKHTVLWEFCLWLTTASSFLECSHILFPEGGTVSLATNLWKQVWFEMVHQKLPLCTQEHITCYLCHSSSSYFLDQGKRVEAEMWRTSPSFSFTLPLHLHLPFKSMQ